MEEKRERRRSFFSRVPKRVGKQNEFFEPLVVLRGQSEASVYGCRKILLYTPQKICLALRKRSLCILGESLSCSAFSGGAVTVEGRIETVRYEKTVAERKEE